MSEISIGLIGAGMMGQEHIQNFNLLDGVCVGAIADTHAGMRDKAAAMCPHKVQAVSDFENCSATQTSTLLSSPHRISII